MDVTLVVLVFLVYGVVALLAPKKVGEFQTWTNKMILGATFKPSKKTYMYYRGFGLLFLVIAVMLMFGVIE